jgi:Phage integrase family
MAAERSTPLAVHAFRAADANKDKENVDDVGGLHAPGTSYSVRSVTLLQEASRPSRVTARRLLPVQLPAHGGLDPRLALLPVVQVRRLTPPGREGAATALDRVLDGPHDAAANCLPPSTSAATHSRHGPQRDIGDVTTVQDLPSRSTTAPGSGTAATMRVPRAHLRGSSSRSHPPSGQRHTREYPRTSIRLSLAHSSTRALASGSWLNADAVRIVTGPPGLRSCNWTKPPQWSAIRRWMPKSSSSRLANTGEASSTSRLVFCRPDGRPLNGKVFSEAFVRQVGRAGLPRITVHGLRHTWATLALAASVHPKVVQERLGHAGIGITLDTYSHVTEGLHGEAANLVAGLIAGDVG